MTGLSQWMNRMERKLGRYAIRNLMTIIVMGMAAVFAIDTFTPLNLSGLLAFNKAAVMRGQIWRLITFIFIPPNASLLFIVFALYFDWLVGSALVMRLVCAPIIGAWASAMVGAVMILASDSLGFVLVTMYPAD